MQSSIIHISLRLILCLCYSNRLHHFTYSRAELGGERLSESEGTGSVWMTLLDSIQRKLPKIRLRLSWRMNMFHCKNTLNKSNQRNDFLGNLNSLMFDIQVRGTVMFLQLEGDIKYIPKCKICRGISTDLF